jgi:AmmeMemoRadiSam system protein B
LNEEPLPIRKSNYSGIYYPKRSQEIIYEIEKFFYKIDSSKKDKEALNDIVKHIKDKKIFSFIVPHGSYFYSGYVSSFVYYLINLIDCDNFIILSSDHKGTSPGISIMNDGSWKTPLGSVTINKELSITLLDKSYNNFINVDPFSLDIDHTIEIQLPFLQYIKNNDFKFIPILQRMQDRASSIRLAEILYSIIPPSEKVILIATSNLSHYLCYDECYRQDKSLMSDVLSFNVNSFYKTMEENLMTICGFGCIATALEFSMKVNNFNAILLKYLTSGDIDKNRYSVVGYSSMIIL